MKQLTHLSLFSGIGGLDLAAEWAGFKTVGQCEWAEYPTKVLEKHWPDVPRWKDIRTLTGGNFYERTGLRTVDIISGGFPCQPFSVAGKQRGKEDDRYLWPEMVRVIKELRPTWVVGENVAGIINLALDTVLSDLESEGYSTRTFLFPAHAVGAPHRRYRTAIVGYTEHNGQPSIQKLRSHEETGNKWWKEEQEAAGKLKGADRSIDVPSICGCEHGSKQNSQITAISESERLQGDWSGGEQICSPRCEERKSERHSDYRRGVPEYVTGEWWATEPELGRVANGIPNRVERLKRLGNAVVPQQFYPVFKAIADIERSQ